MGTMTSTTAYGHRRLLLLVASCLVPVVFVIITISFLHSSNSQGKYLPNGPTVPEFGDDATSKSYNGLQPLGPASSSSATPSLGHNSNEWGFNPDRDGRNFGLSSEQCHSAFPNFYKEIERAVAWRHENHLPTIQEWQMDISWRQGGEIIRLMIYERQLYVVDCSWAKHGYDVPRAVALLHAIHRSIIAYDGPLPNIEFTMSLGDWPGDNQAKWPIWVLTRFSTEMDKWVMPDFGYWSWPLEVIGEYTQVRNDIRENEPNWEEKIRKAVWRGSTKTNRLREDLLRASEGRHWSDIQRVEWINMTTMEPGSEGKVLTMADHCNYQYLVHTEGHTYSGRGKYLLNCESVSVVHKPDWIEPHTHLMVPTGPQQNIIQVERDFSDLNNKISHHLEAPAEAQRIAQNSVNTFRDRYLTPAAQACYWRELFRAWSTVSFEPDLYRTIKDSHGKVRRRSRGVPFETFVAAMVMPG